MTIAAAEDWLKLVSEDAIGNTAVTVMPGPYEWDGSFLKKLVSSLPAVVIVWDGGEATAGTSLTLDATWTFYIVTGWKGEDFEARRRAADGAYMILTLVASRLHNASMGEDRQYSADGSRIIGADPIEGFGRLRVSRVTNEGSGDWERVGVAIYALEIEQQMPLIGPDAEGFDSWLRTGVSWDIPHGEDFEYGVDTIGEDGDQADRFDMPQ